MAIVVLTVALLTVLQFLISLMSWTVILLIVFAVIPLFIACITLYGWWNRLNSI